MQKPAMTFSNVKWESYVELIKQVKETYFNYSIRYNGSDIRGDVEIFAPRYGSEEEMKEVLVMAASTVEFFV